MAKRTYFDMGRDLPDKEPDLLFIPEPLSAELAYIQSLVNELENQRIDMLMRAFIPEHKEKKKT